MLSGVEIKEDGAVIQRSKTEQLDIIDSKADMGNTKSCLEWRLKTAVQKFIKT